MEGVEGRGPHGGYDTATNKCGVCHGIHSGGTTTTVGTVDASNVSLTRAGVTGCEYCHVGSGILGSSELASNDQVYTANDGNVADLGEGNSGHAITGDSVTVPASNIGSMTLSCASCHSVHGAFDNWLPTDFYSDGKNTVKMDTAQWGYMLLKANPGGANSEVPTQSDSEVTDPGSDPAAVNQFALSAWCANCHNKTTKVQAMDTAEEVSQDTTFTAPAKVPAPGGLIHTTTTIATADVNGAIPGPHESTMAGIGTGALQCYTCHRGGGLSAIVPTPDKETADTLTALGYTPAKTDADAACSLCHYGTADFATDPANLNGTSDWPHSSKGDVSMLGNWTTDFTDASNPTTATASGGRITADNAQEMTCGRCHPVVSKTTTDITFTVTPHNHSFVGTANTLGTLLGGMSPGYSSEAGK